MSQTTADTAEEYSDLIDAIANDPSRGIEETETGINFVKPDDLMTVNTAEKALMKRLLSHDEFVLKWYETSHDDDNRFGQTVKVEEYREEGHDGRKPVYSVGGTLPIGALKISPASRKASGHANIISAKVFDDE